MADSWALIDFMQKGPHWETVRRYLVSSEEIVVTPLLVSELYYRIEEKEDEATALEAVRFVRERTRICELSVETAVAAGKTHLKEKLPLVDAFTLAVARKENAKVLTGDPHFKKIKEVIFLGD